ncbi:hypothetical protein RA274_28945, partial [Pseudomonas syringae pv. tagetis]
SWPHRQIFVDIFRAGPLQGEFCEHADLDLLAWYYFGILQAIVILPSTGATRQTLACLIDLALLTWPQCRIEK